MVGIPFPQPDRILNYPQNGEPRYLLRKKLTISDLAIGLILAPMQSDHLMRLPRPLLDAIVRDGLMVQCYTPAIHHGVVLTFDGVEDSFRFQSSGGWDDVASENRLGVGDQIDCWSLYDDAENGLHGKLSFLIQKVGGSETFHASASGGTAMSSI